MRAPCAAPLESLHAALADTRAFVALLEDERAVLLAGDADLLSSIAARKSELAQRMAGRNPDLRAACAEAPVEAILLRSQLLECAARARSANEHNRTLVELRLQHVGCALAVLVGGAASNAGATYSAEGRTRPRPRGRSLATA